MSTAGTTLRGTTLRDWRHEPPGALPAIRAGERPHPGHRRPHARLSPGLAVAVLVEAGLVVAVLAMAARPPVPPPVEVTIAIVTSMPSPPSATPPLATPLPVAALAPPPPAPEAPLAPEAPPAPPPLLPDPAAPQDVLALPPDTGADAPEAPHADRVAGPDLPAVPAPPRPPTHLPPRRVARTTEPARRPPGPVTRTAAVAIAPPPEVAAAPAATLPATAEPSRAGLDTYEGRLRAAIQAALHYPPAAAMMGSDGRARVAFAIRDARPDAIRLVRGTGSPQLDLAALAAVRQAAYPSPPAAIAGREMAMLVWVEFRRTDAEE